MTTLTFPKYAKDIITAEIPESLIKVKPGKAAANYISGSTVVDLLNQAFGYMWSFETPRQWVQESVDKFNPKYDKEPVPQGPVAHVMGRLTVHIPDGNGNFFTVVKEQYGSKAVIGGQMDQEHIFKAAGTDAMKKCASLFGIGLQLYRDEDEQEYFDMMNYEDPWTDEMLEKHAGNRQSIKDFMSKFELGADDMAAYLEAFSDGEFNDMSYIMPDNIEPFVLYLKQIEEDAE